MAPLSQRPTTTDMHAVSVHKKARHDDPTNGTGKPEPLKHNLSCLWSRRISRRDRVIYKSDERCVYIFAIGGHYDRF